MHRSLLALCSACAILLFPGAGPHAHAQHRQLLSFDQMFKSGEPQIIRPLPTITGWADGERYLVSMKKPDAERSMTYAVHAETGADTVYLDVRSFAGLTGAEIDPSSPAARTDNRERFVYSHRNDLYLLDTRAGSFRRLTESAEEEKNPTFSPDGATLAYTRENDLYTYDIAAGRETRLTTDGSPVILNGWASWVYYEEILGRATRYRAFWWSPDSKRIAFYRFDDSRVPEFPLFNAPGVHGELEVARYPKPGDPNPAVRIGIVARDGGPVTWAAFDEHQDQYFGPPFWTPSGTSLFVQWMNRGQDTLVIFSIDPASGRKHPLTSEHQASWVDWFESIEVLEDGSGFLVISDRSGWPHIYLHAMDGTLKRQLTDGAWAVTGIQTVDLKTSTLFFTARKEASTRTDLYSVRLDGRKLTRLTFGPFTHTTRVAPKGAYFITTYSSLSTPARMALVRRNGSIVRELGDSKTGEFDNFRLALPEFVTIPTPDGYSLPAVWTLPVDFDPAKVYPVVISVYGGPNSASVVDDWKPLSIQWLAQEGAIQLTVDHRGSGHFGKKATALMHRRLGTWEMHDYAAAVQWLRAQPFVDSTRICITGGSYGGYVTALALTAGAEHFTHGIAEYSVVDWRLYDSHYTERYMDTPAENPGGYAEGSVLTHARKYKGLLRIVHGTMDDNVHMQNSLQLVDTLQQLNKHFELMLYPGARHGWGGQKAVHLRSETYRFYYRHLLRREFPDHLFSTLDASSMRRRRP